MNEHVLDWIGAYHDGELHGDRRRAVEAHLRTCAVCQAELAAVQNLALRLQASPPMPARTPPEQFVAQVRLRLPPRTAPVPSRVRLQQATGLWLPLSVLGLWAFGQAVLLVSALAVGVGGLPAAVSFVLPPLPGLGPLPLLSALTPPAVWSGWLTLLALNAGLTAAAAVLVWGCLAGWWAAHKTDYDTSLASSGLPAGG